MVCTCTSASLLRRRGLLPVEPPPFPLEPLLELLEAVDVEVGVPLEELVLLLLLLLLLLVLVLVLLLLVVLVLVLFASSLASG
jgi:hypothetical protein